MQTTTIPAEAVQEFIDEVSLMAEKFGYNRTASRIIGYLLVAEPAHQSAKQLGEILQVSKGSISTELRYLLEGGEVVKVRLPGERVEFYRLSDNYWERELTKYLRSIEAGLAVADKGVNLLKCSPRDQHRRISEMAAYLKWRVDVTREHLNDWPKIRTKLVAEKLDEVNCAVKDAPESHKTHKKKTAN